jgi:Sec-independent protein translocase protein TatA
MSQYTVSSSSVIHIGKSLWSGLGADVGESIRGFRNAVKDVDVDPGRDRPPSANALGNSEVQHSKELR